MESFNQVLEQTLADRYMHFLYFIWMLKECTKYDAVNIQHNYANYCTSNGFVNLLYPVICLVNV